MNKPPIALTILGAVTTLLALSFAFPPTFLFITDYSPQKHALMEYLTAYLGLVLFLICLRRFHLQRTKDFLFLGIGSLAFAILQVLHVIASPGFHDLAWIPASENIGVAFDQAGRVLMGVYFILGISHVQKRLLKPGFRHTALIYLNGIVLVFFVAFCILFFLAPVLFLDGQVTSLAGGIDLAVAALLILATIAAIRGLLRERQAVFFSFATAAVVGVFANVYLSLSMVPGDFNFQAGHLLKILFLATLLTGVLAGYFRFTKVEMALTESRKLAEDRATAHDSNYRLYVERMDNGLIVVDRKGLLTFCNKAFVRLLKSSEEELLGTHLSLLLDPDSYKSITSVDGRDQELRPGYHEVGLLSRHSDKIPVGIEIVRMTDANGRYSGAQAVTTDATVRKETREKLERQVREKTRSLEIFEQCIENSTEGVLIADPDGKITYVNQAFEKMTGFDKSRLIRQDISILQHDLKGQNSVENIWRSVRDGRIWRGEFSTKKNNGSSFLGELSVIPIRSSDGRLRNCLWIERDITRKKALERSLEKYAAELTDKTSDLEAAKSYYETLIAGISDIFIVVNNEGDCTFINDYAKSRLSFTADELTKSNLPVFFDDLKRLENDYGSALKVEIKDFESAIKTRSGESILCSWHARPLFDNQNRRIGAVTIGRDITEYKKIQDELYEYARDLEVKVKDRTKDLHIKVNQLSKLLEIEEEIRLNLDIDVVLNKICEAAQGLGWNRVVISLRDDQAQVSRPVAVIGLEAAEVEKILNWRIPFEHTNLFFKEEFRLGNSFFVSHVNNLVQEDTPYSIYTDLGVRQEDEWHGMDALLVPIRAKDKIRGHISVDDPESRRKPRLEDVRDLEILADNAALAIENARLFNAQQESENRTTVLAEISRIFYASLDMDEVARAIVQKGAEAIGEFCSLFLVDDKGQYLDPHASFHQDQKVVHLFVKGAERYRLAIGKGMVSEVVTTGKTWSGSRPFPAELNNFVESPMFYIEQKYSIYSLMLLPLQVHDRRIGAMLFLRTKSKVKYQKRDLDLARDLADRAALAMENARLFREAGEKAKELEKANKLKSEFLANVSHELRTPLNAIITLSDILIRGIPGNLNTEQSKQIQIIQRSGRNLLNIISDILDIAKIEAGRLEPVYSMIPIRAVVEETVEHVRPLCVGMGLNLHFEYSDAVPEFVYSDQDKLTKALTNVLSNAVKFTHKGKIQVVLSVTDDGSGLKIQVTDTGIGIPGDRMEEIFKEFHQIDSSASRTFGGTGLGLAITRNVLSLIGGSVKVKSQLGKGSTFTLYLPLKLKPEVKEDEPLPLAITLADEPDTSVELDLTDDRNRLDQKKRAILVVDDEDEAIYMIRQYLSKSRYQLIFPRNGEDAVELARKYNPYAITLDLIMPGRSGWQVLKSLKQDAQTRDIPVIVTSVLSEKERAFEMGAAEYMVKPFEPEKLLLFLEGLDTNTEIKKIVLDFPRFMNLKKIIRSKMQAFRAKSESPSVANSTVLLVDDDPDTQYAVRYILEEVGYTVFISNDGNEAVQQAESIVPSLILMDMMMPGMDGYEATARLKKMTRLKDIPIVAMTAKAMKGDRQKVIAAGCDDYLAKPFMSKDILKIVETWIVKSNTASNLEEA